MHQWMVIIIIMDDQDMSNVRKVTLKSAPAISDENQISILNLSEAVMKPVTSTMSLWSEMMVNFNTPTEK